MQYWDGRQGGNRVVGGTISLEMYSYDRDLENVLYKEWIMKVGKFPMKMGRSCDKNEKYFQVLKRQCRMFMDFCS